MHVEDLKRIRAALSCSVGELAATLGVDVETVLAWEAGDRFPTKRHADRLRALESQGPSAVKRFKSKKPAAESGLDLLADPRLWTIVRKLVAYPELFSRVFELSEAYAEPPRTRGD